MNSRESQEFFSSLDVEYLDVQQHWCPSSEQYGGGDCLITLISAGWVLAERIYIEYKRFNGNRRTTIYHCRLTRGEDTMEMPVIENPYVARLVWQRQLIQINNEQEHEAFAIAEMLRVAA